MVPHLVRVVRKFYDVNNKTKRVHDTVSIIPPTCGVVFFLDLRISLGQVERY